MMSQITVEKTAEDSASKSLRVTVPVDRVREAEAKAVKYYAQRARLPGFRPGKAPEAVVRKRFGDAIRQTVLEEVHPRGLGDRQELNESLKPIADPSIRNLKFEEGSPIEFELHVEVRPEIKLDRIGGFKVERQVAPVPDGAVDEQLASLQEQKAAWIPVDRREAVAGPDGPGRGRADRERHRGRRRSPTTWCWGRTRPSRSWRSGSWRSCPARPPRPRSGSPTTTPTRAGGARPGRCGSPCTR